MVRVRSPSPPPPPRPRASDRTRETDIDISLSRDRNDVDIDVDIQRSSSRSRSRSRHHPRRRHHHHHDDELVVIDSHRHRRAHSAAPVYDVVRERRDPDWDRERELAVHVDIDRGHSHPAPPPPPPPTKEMWTEVSKDLVSREAIETMGYSYEETTTAFYIMDYLHSVSAPMPCTTQMQPMHRNDERADSMFLLSAPARRMPCSSSPKSPRISGEGAGSVLGIGTTGTATGATGGTGRVGTTTTITTTITTTTTTTTITADGRRGPTSASGSRRSLLTPAGRTGAEVGRVIIRVYHGLSRPNELRSNVL